MKCLLAFWFCCLIIANCFAQKKKDIDSINKQIHLKENKIYVFCRGTTAKSGLIAHEFNLADTNITHVGLGFYSDKKISIYNVTDNGSSLKNALMVDSLGSFISSNDVYFLSVWECDNTLTEFEKFKTGLLENEKRKIVFDAFFNINNDDTLYCSEFCVSILNAVNNKRYHFKPRELLLNNRLYEDYLQRKIFRYYPVDFFETNKNIHRLFYCRF